MKSRRIASTGAFALVLVVVSLASVTRAASPEGRWRLVEQRYESGAANTMADGPVLRLEFTREGGRLAARMWAGDDSAAAVPWPAFSASEGKRAALVLERGEDALAGEVAVRYRIPPATGDDLVLDVTERYKVSSDGETLEGTVEVRFLGGDKNRGGYTLHRRFEREK
jgi:hypothetical protein